jgi:hypothetical protein
LPWKAAFRQAGHENRIEVHSDDVGRGAYEYPSIAGPAVMPGQGAQMIGKHEDDGIEAYRRDAGQGFELLKQNVDVGRVADAVGGELSEPV